MRITKCLIANRGEIALRIQRTCREMGLATVAVYSECDARAPHAREADEAVAIGPSPSRESYLHIERLIEAARKTGADAVHPGYGFLSENADFAEACVKAGLVFIGPSADAIRKMGEKSASKRIMAKAGVPIVPGYEGDDQRTETLRAKAMEIGFPLLVKASAGGGGKGMRIVRQEKDLLPALEAAKREAGRAFGSESLLLEKYFSPARHIEVQIFGDRHGHLLHLFERECSLQRRHQKVIEECPSPALNEASRGKLYQAAIAAGRAIGYDNAGTVEFLFSESGEFHFLEMNTRLQVEHPVTEMVTGLDLVRWQIEVAEGKPLPLRQEEIPRRGHAIEARLYAENPAKRFVPAPGKILHWRSPERLPGIRVDAGVETGSEISIFYDPMLAKVVAHGADREEATRKLVRALREMSAQGLVTNREFLIALLQRPEVAQGRLATGFIEEHLEALVPRPSAEQERLALIAATAWWREMGRSEERLLAGIPLGYRNNPFRYPSLGLAVDGRAHEVSYYFGGDGKLRIGAGGDDATVEVLAWSVTEMRLAVDGRQLDFGVARAGERLYLQSREIEVSVERLPRLPRADAQVEKGGVLAPMTGKVMRVLVAKGQAVQTGQPLVVIEAMKMEQTIHAAAGGTIAEVRVQEGETVPAGFSLIDMEEDSSCTNESA